MIIDLNESEIALVGGGSGESSWIDGLYELGTIAMNNFGTYNPPVVGQVGGSVSTTVGVPTIGWNGGNNSNKTGCSKEHKNGCPDLE